MSLFDKVVSKVKENKQIRESGGVIAIPWSFNRLSQVLPGVRKGIYALISAGTKEGKTQIADYLYIYEPIEWLLKNKDKGIKYKVKYFSLELSKDVKISQAICYKLFTSYGINIAPEKLLSIFHGYIVEDEIVNIIESDAFKEWFKFFEETVEIIDSVRNPYGIFLNVKAYMESNGTYTYKEIDWQDEAGKYSKRTVIDTYIPNDPKLIVNVIGDHYSLLQAEKGQTLFEAIKIFSNKYILEMRDKWDCAITMIQQQSASSTDMQYTNKGETILDKVRPSREGLSDCRYTAQDASLMLGMFSPYKYKESEYEGWDLNKLKDNHRELSIILNRSGVSNASVQLYFNGAVNVFRELPKLTGDPFKDKVIQDQVYKEVERIRSITK